MRLLSVSILLAGAALLALSVSAQTTKSKQPSPGEESLKDKKEPTKNKKDKKKKFLMPLPIFRDGKLADKSLNEWLKDIPTKGEAFPDTGRVETALMAIQAWQPDDIYDAGGLRIMFDELDQYRKKKYIDISSRANLAIAIGYVVGGLIDKDNAPTSKDVKLAVELLTYLIANDTQEIVKLRALEALGRIGPDAGKNKQTVAWVSELAKSWDPNKPAFKPLTNTWEVRQAAAIALGNIGKGTKDVERGDVLETLFYACFDPRWAKQGEPTAAVRLAAIQSLTWLGAPSAKEYKELMIKYVSHVGLYDSDAGVRIWAHVAVMSMAYSEHPGLIAPIAKHLSDKDHAVRIHAAKALATIAHTKTSIVKPHVKELVACLKDDDPVVVGWCVYALGHLWQSAESAKPALERVRDNEKMPGPVRQAAAEALDKISKLKKGSK
jgi:non-SMC mitotic condensation complex subunit 1